MNEFLFGLVYSKAEMKRFIFGRERRDLIIGKVNCMDDRPQWTTECPWIFFFLKTILIDGNLLILMFFAPF